MASIRLKLTTQSPLLVAVGPPSHNLIETLDFIPGNTIRGLLAQRYIDQKKQTDDVFSRLFLSGQIRFGFAFINGSQAIPLSAYSCKYTGGFENDKGHGITDMLQEGNGKYCPICEKPLDHFEGFWNPSEKTAQSIRKRLITRTAIDPVLGCAGSGQLYSQRVIEEGQTFFSNIEAPDDLASELTGLISNPFVACIGTGRSRGQGWIEVKRDVPEDLSKNDTAKERFQRFKSKVLAITLLSDAIFHDEYLRDCTAPAVSHLEPLGIEPDDWEPLPSKAFAVSRMVFGFDGIPLQLPRVPRSAVSAGSVFLFDAKGGREPVVPDGNGIGWIGDSNGEGFGHAVLWHTFHVKQDKLATALRQKEAFLKQEDSLLRKARDFYGLGFIPRNLSSSQMSAVNECIHTSGSIEDVKKAVGKFINGQVEKLKKQKERSGKSASWLIAPTGDGGKGSLGETLLDWINEGKYSPEIAGNDRLSALRRFWSNVYGLYRYRKVFKEEDMPLREELLS